MLGPRMAGVTPDRLFGSGPQARFRHNALCYCVDAPRSDDRFFAPAVTSRTFWDPELMADRTFGVVANCSFSVQTAVADGMRRAMSTSRALG